MHFLHHTLHWTVTFLCACFIRFWFFSSLNLDKFLFLANSRILIIIALIFSFPVFVPHFQFRFCKAYVNIAFEYLTPGEFNNCIDNISVITTTLSIKNLLTSYLLVICDSLSDNSPFWELQLLLIILMDDIGSPKQQTEVWMWLELHFS